MSPTDHFRWTTPSWREVAGLPQEEEQREALAHRRAVATSLSPPDEATSPAIEVVAGLWGASGGACAHQADPLRWTFVARDSCASCSPRRSQKDAAFLDELQAFFRAFSVSALCPAAFPLCSRDEQNASRTTFSRTQTILGTPDFLFTPKIRALCAPALSYALSTYAAYDAPRNIQRLRTN